LNVLVTNGKAYMLIAEDLNGTSNGRTPAGISNRTCELYLLDMSLEDPTLDDMVRISIVPLGAEMTGVQPTPDGKTILANSQHPSSSNPYPYNNSLTFAITGWDEAITAITSLEGIENQLEESLEFQVWPNPVSRQLNFNQVIDAALYDNSGKRIKVFRAQKSLDVSDIKAGVYFLKTDSGKGRKLIIQ
ncbi:MAG: T9SS type A sorting domain-containing protein, partial [Bacteroidota bacterium]